MFGKSSFQAMRTKASLKFLVIPALLVSSAGVANAQRDGGFYDGVRDGGRGGRYEHRDHREYANGYNNQYNNGYYSNDPRYNRDPRYNDPRYHEGGIGPGKGALIGGAGGAVLGALFGGGLKGSLIGGAAGAGIGAVAGKAHQDSTRRRDGYYPR